MASLQQEQTGKFHIVIFHQGKRFKRSLYTRKKSVALARKDEIEELMGLVRRKRILVPDGVDFIEFVMSDGKVEPPEVAATLPTPLSANVAPPTAGHSVARTASEDEPTCTVEGLLDGFVASIPDGSLEQNTLSQMDTHRRHLIRLLGADLRLTDITAKQLQDYINSRAKEPTQRIRDKSLPKKKQTRVPVSSATIRKELVTLGSAWRWGESMGYLTGPLPKRGLRWPKVDEKPPFQTWDEIVRQVQQDGLSSSEADLLWDCLYLRCEEVERLLQCVRDNHSYDYVFPFFAMAAYTGARRSELLRSRRSDFDFESSTVTIRELKRVKGKRSTRRVPLCDKLQTIMRQWFEKHRQGTWTFVTPDRFSNMKQVTHNQAQHHFNSTLIGSRWEPVKGWHCLRHSFISNLACAGIDQRIIDEFVGHTTEDMRRRYRHLLPNVKHAAMSQVFGSTGTGRVDSNTQASIS